MDKQPRQRRLLEIISARRYEKLAVLARELGVSKKTIMRDLDELSGQAAFYTKCGKEDGGVYACEHWYFSRVYYTPEQEQVLRMLLAGLQPDSYEAKQVQSALDAFAMPKVQKDA